MLTDSGYCTTSGGVKSTWALSKGIRVHETSGPHTAPWSGRPWTASDVVLYPKISMGGVVWGGQSLYASER